MIENAKLCPMPMPVQKEDTRPLSDLVHDFLFSTHGILSSSKKNANF